jgi:hypothetical protein
MFHVFTEFGTPLAKIATRGIRGRSRTGRHVAPNKLVAKLEVMGSYRVAQIDIEIIPPTRIDWVVDGATVWMRVTLSYRGIAPAGHSGWMLVVVAVGQADCRIQKSGATAHSSTWQYETRRAGLSWVASSEKNSRTVGPPATW